MKKLVSFALAIMVLLFCLSSCVLAEEPDETPDNGITDNNNQTPDDPTPDDPTPDDPTPDDPTPDDPTPDDPTPDDPTPDDPTPDDPTPDDPTPDDPTPDDPVVHTHTYSDIWTYDETDHWRKATCTETEECAEAVTAKESHDFTSGDECICGYKKPKEEPKPEILGPLSSDYGILLSNGTKIDVNYYPGFVRKALTFTIDDGVVDMDRLFLDIVRPAGIKGTFNLCDTDRLTAAEYLLLYEGYEVANHNLIHSLPFRDDFDYSNIEIKDEVFNSSTADPAYMYKHATIDGLYYIDYRHYTDAYDFAYWHPIATNETYIKYVNLTTDSIESVFGEGSVVGYAYPHGAVNEYIKQYLKDNGYLYARDTGSLLDKTGFSLPADRFAWTYNADHTNLLATMAKYDAYGDDGELKFFSFGVHASDYKNSWDMLTEFAETYGNRADEFYYGTNREIFEYEDAIKSLVITEESITNPSDITVYITVNNVKVKLPAGATLNLSDIEAEAPKSEITFENVAAENLPAPLTTNLTSTVAKEIGVLISEVCGSKKLVLKTGNDGADKIAVKLTTKALEYDAVTLKSDVTLDTEGEGVSFMLHFKSGTGVIVHQMTLSASVGRVAFSDYYKKPGATSGEYTFSSEQGYTTEITGHEFTMVLEISKNEDDRTILRIFANGRFVAESTHSALADVALEDIASFEFTSVTASEGSLMLDNLSLKRTMKIEEPAKDALAEIMPVKGGAGGIVVLVHDDGDLASAALLDSIYEKYGIVGDVALIANRVWDVDSGAPITDVQQGWQALLDNGRWGLINHSLTHTFWGTSADGELTIDEDMLYDEIVTSGEILRKVFPNERVLTFAYPGVSAITNVHGTWPAYKKAVSLVLEHYVGARNYSGGTIPIDKTIHAYANGRTLGGGTSDYQMIDAAAANNNILVFLMHRVVESNPTGSTISSSAVQGIAEYISEYVNEGKVWSAHFEDAMLYTKEARYATVSSSVFENGIKLNVTDTLDNEIYNYPLTVKVKVDSAWEAVKLTQGERVFYALTKTENGETYALVDVVPDGGEAVVTSYAKADVPEEFIPVVKPPHEHTYSETYTYDKENHWKVATCDAKIACATAVADKASHELDENGKCYCGYEKHYHTYSAEWSYDNTEHWHAATCNAEAECKTARSDVGYHDFGDGTLCACGYEKPPKATTLGYFDLLGGFDYEDANNHWNWSAKNTAKIIRNTGWTSGDQFAADGGPNLSAAGYLNFYDFSGDRIAEFGKGTSNGNPSEIYFVKQGGSGNTLVFETDIRLSTSTALASASDKTFLTIGFINEMSSTAVGYGAVSIIGVPNTDAITSYTIFDTTLSADVWYNLAVEFDTVTGIATYYIDAEIVGTARFDDVPADIGYLRATLSGNARAANVKFNDTYFGSIGKHLTESDEYYTFGDGVVPSGITLDKRSEGGAIKVGDAPFLNTTEKALNFTTTAGGDDRFYFTINPVDGANKIVLETKYRVDATANGNQIFEFMIGNNRTSYLCIARNVDGSITISDYIEKKYSFSTITLKDVSAGWMDLKIVGYEDETEGLVFDIIINGKTIVTSKNEHFLGNKVSDIARLRYYTYSSLDAEIYFDDLKIEKIKE